MSKTEIISPPKVKEVVVSCPACYQTGIHYIKWGKKSGVFTCSHCECKFKWEEN